MIMKVAERLRRKGYSEERIVKAVKYGNITKYITPYGSAVRLEHEDIKITLSFEKEQ